MPDNLIEQLETGLAVIKNTATGKVEYNLNSESLRSVMLTIFQLFVNQGVVVVDTLTDLQALEQPQPVAAISKDAGLFVFYDNTYTPAPDRYPATGGGYWQKVTDVPSLELGDLANVTVGSASRNDVLYYNGDNDFWENISIPALIALGGWPTSLAGYGITANSIYTRNGTLLKTFNNPTEVYSNTAANSIGVLMRAIPNLTIGSNAVVITGSNSLYATNPAKELDNTVVIGNVGSLTALGDPSTGVLAIGHNGYPVLSVNADGDVSINNAANENSINAYGDLSVTQTLAVAGASSLHSITGSTAALTGAITGASISVSGDSTVTGNETVGGTLGVTGAGTFNAGTFNGKLYARSGGLQADAFGTPGTPAITHGLADNTVRFFITIAHTGPSASMSSLTMNGTTTINGLSVYADNAAAIAGGLAAGNLYRTSVGVLMVRY